MAITDLTNTKWLLNESLTTGDGNSYYINFTVDTLDYDNNDKIDFTCFECAYKVYLKLSNKLYDFNYYTDEEGENPSLNNQYIYIEDGLALNQYCYDKNSEEGIKARTITIIDGTDVTNTSLISWLQNNATQIIDSNIKVVSDIRVNGKSLRYINGKPLNYFTVNNTTYMLKTKTTLDIISNNDNSDTTKFEVDRGTLIKILDNGEVTYEGDEALLYSPGTKDGYTFSYWVKDSETTKATNFYLYKDSALNGIWSKNPEVVGTGTVKYVVKFEVDPETNLFSGNTYIWSTEINTTGKVDHTDRNVMDTSSTALTQKGTVYNDGNNAYVDIVTKYYDSSNNLLTTDTIRVEGILGDVTIEGFTNYEKNSEVKIYE